MEESKPIHAIVLDTGPIILNEPSISSLHSQAQRLVTIPGVVSEIKDAESRSRFDTLWRPFLELREPQPASIKVITDFARRTGDLAVLSKPDIQILALAYEIECEENGGDWRLRRVPGQKHLNGPEPSRKAEVDSKSSAPTAQSTAVVSQNSDERLNGSDSALTSEEESKYGTLKAASSDNVLHVEATKLSLPDEPVPVQEAQPMPPSTDQISTTLEVPDANGKPTATADDSNVSSIVEGIADLNVGVPLETPSQNSPVSFQDFAEAESDSDSEGWITPSNIKKQKEKDEMLPSTSKVEQTFMQVATLTTDYAMQNVLLQMNLNLLSPSFRRIRHLKTHILRCHACFMNVKDMTKQFCPRCGKPTLTRVTCSTNDKGEFQLHLKKNMQWNTRGDRYSIPKAVSGSANGKVNVGGGGKGGGKGGWGQGLILTEDQREYVRALNEQKREKQRNLMDEDYLPSILTGDRGKTGGRPKIGAGRTVNSKKR